MITIKRLCLAILLAAWGGYYLNFGINGVLSQKTEVWGQFGDYVGGVVNPILSFVTIYLLIQSIGLQRESNDSLVKEIQRQERLEEYKKFEIRLFRLIELQEESFSRFRISIVPDDTDSPAILARGGAVKHIVDRVYVLVQGKIEKSRITEWIMSLDEENVCFSLARRFYLIIKLIDKNTISKNEREELYETLINLTDTKALEMICILSIYFDWEATKYINTSGILNRAGLREFIAMNKS